MDITGFIKEKWNLVLGIALAIAVILTGFVIPPNISFTYAEGDINYRDFARFIVAGIILIVLVPCSIYNKKEHTWKWWVFAVFLFVLSFIFFFRYNKLVNEVTTYNRYYEERVVIGQTLLPLARRAIDSLIRSDGIDTVSSSYALETLGEPTDIWMHQEIADNGNRIIRQFMYTIIAFSLFILSSIQAVYCVGTERTEKLPLNYSDE